MSFFNQSNNMGNRQYSANEPNPQFYVQGAPYQVPFQNNFPAIVNGYVIKLLQDNAQKNPLRCYMFNMASDNAWQNDTYYTLLNSTTQLAEAMAKLPASQGQSQEQIVANAANEIVTCYTATIAQQNPMVKNMMGIGIDAEIQRLLQRQAQLEQAVAQVNQQAQFQQSPWPNTNQQFNNNNWPGNQQQSSFQAARQGTGWPYSGGGSQPAGNPNINWGRFAGTQSTIAQANAVYDNPNSGYKGRTALRPQGAEPAPQQVQQETPASTSNAFVSSRGRSSQGPVQPTGQPNGVVEEMFNDFGTTNVQPQQPVNKQQQEFAARVEKQRAQAALTPEPLVEPTQATTGGEASLNSMVDKNSINEERPFDYVRLQNGSEIRPAHSSGWDRTWTVDNPWPEAFNPLTHMKFHIRAPQADGSFIVKEVVKEISEAEMEQMEYLQHEIRQRKPYQLDETKRVVPTNWREVADLDKPQVVVDPEDHSETPVENPEVKIIPTEIEAHSFQEAEIKCLNEVLKLGSDNFEGKVREYYFREMKPISVDGAMIGVMLELAKKTTLVGAARFLADHMEREQITARLYNVLNEALTERVNEALSINLGYGNALEIENFVADIESLGEALLEDQMGLLWTLLNQERAEDIIKAVSNILKGDEYWDYLSKLGDQMTRENKAKVNSILARFEKFSVTHVPWSVEIYGEQAQSVKASTQPELHAACVALLDRCKGQAVKFSRHYIVDVYGRVTEVLPGYLGMKAVLVRSVKL
ncbi:hypothetical protein [Streptomyces sp. CHB9.2]|uniref:hypothetical protein n=1 Tax=Streptomyces sp. CHB9.2 TaxID=2841670 RepID=UPI00209485AC|nr:hypothetical protein [Streptomyces sp. CHB9.2]MCO6704803.1 hypothetical protein [Streptomyces sp. CHB9.2]